MNQQTPLTADAIRSALARRASRGSPGELLEQILATTEVTTQRGQRLRISTWSGFRPAMAAAAVAVVVLGIVIGLAGMTKSPDTAASPSPTPAPASPSPSPAGSGRASTFVRPFDYAIPAGLALADPVFNEHIYELFEEGSNPGWGPADGLPREGHGVTVVSAETPLVHGTPARVPIRTKPQDFLEDLRTIGHVNIGEPSPALLDGRPALVVTVEGPGLDFHYGPGLSTDVGLDVGSRIIVADVDGITIVVVIWATDEDDMAAWLPTATALVDSMTFAPVGR